MLDQHRSNRFHQHCGSDVTPIVAFFRNAGTDLAWKLLVPKKQWKKTVPVKIAVQGNTLQLVDATPETLKRNAPQQSVPNPPTPKPAAVTEYGTQAG